MKSEWSIMGIGYLSTFCRPWLNWQVSSIGLNNWNVSFSCLRSLPKSSTLHDEGEQVKVHWIIFILLIPCPPDRQTPVVVAPSFFFFTFQDNFFCCWQEFLHRRQVLRFTSNFESYTSFRPTSYQLCVDQHASYNQSKVVT